MSTKATKTATPKVDVDQARSWLERTGLLHAKESLNELLAAAIKSNNGPHKLLEVFGRGSRL